MKSITAANSSKVKAEIQNLDQAVSMTQSTVVQTRADSSKESTQTDPMSPGTAVHLLGGLSYSTVSPVTNILNHPLLNMAERYRGKCVC